MENRQAHLEWCKNRALEYVDAGDLKNAFASMLSDMTKHPETFGHAGLEMGTTLFFGGHLSTGRQMREWITGFN